MPLTVFGGIGLVYATLSSGIGFTFAAVGKDDTEKARSEKALALKLGIVGAATFPIWIAMLYFGRGTVSVDEAEPAKAALFPRSKRALGLALDVRPDGTLLTF